jgi:hypothetical protein
MCFSVEADVALGIAVGAVGVDALRHVTRPAQLPLGVLPLVFAVHQLNEAFVWWGLDGVLGTGVANAAAWLYLFIAFAFPIVVPIAAARVEPDRVRRSVMWGFAVVGGLVSAVLLTALFRNGPNARIEDFHIAYSVDTSYGGQLAVLYVLATCGAFLSSSDRRIALVGALNLAAVVVMAWLLMSGAISLWCAWAAVVSVLIAGYLRTATAPDEAARVDV